MRHLIVKMILLGLMLYVGKASVLAQNTDIKCEVSSFDLNLSGSEVINDFGSFSFSEKDEKGSIAKYYKLPRTKLILSILVRTPKDEMSDGPFDNKLVVSMILGKKRISPSPPNIHSSNLDEEKMIKDAANAVFAGYPIGSFDKGGEGMLYMPFVGKKRPVHIMMKCKRSS